MPKIVKKNEARLNCAPLLMVELMKEAIALVDGIIDHYGRETVF